MKLYVDDDIYLRDIVDSDEEYKRLYSWCLNPSVYEYFEQRVLSYDEVVNKYKRRVGNEDVKTLIIVYKKGDSMKKWMMMIEKNFAFC